MLTSLANMSPSSVWQLLFHSIRRPISESLTGISNLLRYFAMRSAGFLVPKTLILGQTYCLRILFHTKSNAIDVGWCTGQTASHAAIEDIDFFRKTNLKSESSLDGSSVYTYIHTYIYIYIYILCCTEKANYLKANLKQRKNNVKTT